jgi:restriction system protein
MAQSWKHGLDGCAGLQEDFSGRAASDCHAALRVSPRVFTLGGVGGGLIRTGDCLPLIGEDSPRSVEYAKQFLYTDIEETMPVPTFADMIPPLLQILAAHDEGIEVAVVYSLVAAAVNLSDEDRALMVPSKGQAVYKNRIGWAHDSLKRMGWSTSPKSGIWKITPAGIDALKGHPGGFTPAERKSISRANATVKMADLFPTISVPPMGEDNVAATPEPVPVVAESDSPDDMIQKALIQIRASVERDILERLRQVTPLKFENIVLDLLHAMGYGLNRESLKRVGGSGDGGIDGIVPLDRLGLHKVYVQAKRWQGAVGSPVVQTFMGALQLHGADRGVLMTSGDFSKPAIESRVNACTDHDGLPI